MTDLLGSRTTLTMVVTIFTIRSLSCGFAGSTTALAIFRGFQGVDAAMMIPVGRILIVKMFNSKELVKVNSYISIPVFFGPILGGYIRTNRGYCNMYNLS